MTNSGMIKSSFTMFDIIEELQKKEEAGVTEIANELNLSKSAVHKHLKSLEQQGFVLNRNGTYSNSLKMLELAGILRDNNYIYQVSRPHAEKLARDIDEMIIITTRELNEGVFLFRTSNRYGLQNLSPLGDRFYLNQTSAGRAMLAEWPDHRIQEFAEETGLPKVMEKNVANIEDLLDEIDNIRRKGYAVSSGERFEGMRAISSSIYNDDTGDLGALSVVVPAGEAIMERLKSDYAEKLIHTAKEVSLNLKYD